MRLGHTHIARHVRATLILLAAGSLVVSSGCSFVASSKSSSKILSSPFTSSSKSSKNDDDYQEQAEGYSKAFFEAGGLESDVFQKGLSDIASRMGISDWEANPGTWTSVGRGLGQAHLSGGDVAEYAANWSGGDRSIMELVLQGFSETR